MNNDIHYRLPLKLITSYTWADLNYPARTILPILGVYADKDGESWPGVKLIAELTGYVDTRYRRIRAGMDDLIEKNLIIRKKEGRHYFYCLTSLALREGRESFFPIYKEAMILSRKWASLTPSERSLYPVFGNKAKINDPDVEYSEFHAIGHIYHSEINKYIEWAGISRRSFDRACIGLNHENLIEFLEENLYRYGIYVPQ